MTLRPRNNIVYLYRIILTDGFVKLIHVMFVEINFWFFNSSVTYHYPTCLDVRTTHASITLGNSNYFVLVSRPMPIPVASRSKA